MLSFLRRPSPAGRGQPARRPQCRPHLEPLEDRLVPYVLSGYTWANPNVSVSFMPDGTLISSSYPSNLFAVYNAAYPQATWQRQVAIALQSWADVSNLNFHFVADDGSPQGTAGLAQGDSRFGDIRIGGYNMGSGILGLGWNPGSTTTAGDVELGTASAFAIGSIPDLASVVMHEVGHAIGFNHSLASPAVMEGGLWGTYPGPYADDIAGVQAMYGARKPDAYDAAASNDTLATATALTLSYGGVAINADISTMTDVDYYKVTAPAGTDGTLTVSVDARNLSLFDPKVSVFNSSGTLLATASASTYGDVATVNLTGLVAGQTYYLQAAGATTDVFGMGAYKLTAQFGGIPQPPPIGPDRFEPNNTLATATNLGKVSSASQTGLTLSSTTDLDYYGFVSAGKGTFTVSVTPTQGSGMLGLSVLNAQQTVLASGQSQTGGVTLSVSLASGTQYYLKVSSPSGSLFVYNLSLAQASGSGGTGGGHKLVALGVEDNTAGDVFYRNAADDPDNVRSAAVNPASGFGQSQLSNMELAAVASAGVPLSAARLFQDGAGSQRGPAGAPLGLGPQAAPLVLAVMPVSAEVVTVSASMVVPDVWPPITPTESDGGDGPLPNDDATDAEQTAAAVSMATPAGAPVAPEPRVRVGVELRPQGCDAGFADDSSPADPAGSEAPLPGAAVGDAGAGADSASAVVALVVVLGGCGGAGWDETKPNRRTQLRR
jgi:hypothetical protein